MRHQIRVDRGCEDPIEHIGAPGKGTGQRLDSSIGGIASVGADNHGHSVLQFRKGGIQHIGALLERQIGRQHPARISIHGQPRSGGQRHQDKNRRQTERQFWPRRNGADPGTHPPLAAR